MGIIKEKNGQFKALGGAILSSKQELENMKNENVTIKHISEFQTNCLKENDEFL